MVKLFKSFTTQDINREVKLKLPKFLKTQMCDQIIKNIMMPTNYITTRQYHHPDVEEHREKRALHSLTITYNSNHESAEN